jgi:hypothetical protein
LSLLKLDETFNDRTVAVNFAEQVIEQGCFSHGTREQFLYGMRFSPYLPHHRFKGEREFAFLAELETFFLCVLRCN